MSRSRSRSYSRSRTRSLSPQKPRQSGSSSDPECPFHIRVFVSKGKHTPMVDFDRGLFPVDQEYSAYVWPHSTPTSLVALLFPSFPAVYRSPQARFSFRHIYVDASARGLYRNTDLISFSGRDLLSTLEAADAKPVDMDMELDDAPDVPKGKKVEEKTLDDYGFITGDLISISVSVPEPRVPRGPPVAGPIGNGSGPERRGFGWANDPRRESRDFPARSAAPADRDTWAKGEALQPGPRYGGRGDRARDAVEPRRRGDDFPPRDDRGDPAARFGRDEPRGGGGWGRGGHMGGRGGPRRSRSPEPRGCRDRSPPRADGARWGRSPPRGRD